MFTARENRRSSVNISLVYLNFFSNRRTEHIAAMREIQMEKGIKSFATAEASVEISLIKSIKSLFRYKSQEKANTAKAAASILVSGATLKLECLFSWKKTPMVNATAGKIGSMYGGSFEPDALKNKNTTADHIRKNLLSRFLQAAATVRGMKKDQGNIPPRITGTK